jgi:hypothetical protein
VKDTLSYFNHMSKDVWRGVRPIRQLEPKRLKNVESCPNTTSAWAGWSRFDIPVDRSDGAHSELIFTMQHYTGVFYLPLG